MRVLWISNIVFPEAQSFLTGDCVSASSGGWMLGAAKALIEQPSIELTVAAPSNAVCSLTELRGERIRYFLFPLGKGNIRKNNEYGRYWRIINDTVQPNVVHIHGTEFSHGLAYVDECGARNVVVSIQGLTSEIARFYSRGLSLSQIIRNMTFGDILRGSIFRDVSKYKQRGRFEIELIEKVNHCIGRTCFDESHIKAINNSIRYYFCNETLRDEFYSDHWQYNKCTPHTIFLSQATSPLKGLHFLLNALAIVKKYYHDVQLHVAGIDITARKHTLRGIYAYSGYGKYIKHLIRSNNLQDNVFFTGPLSSAQMKEALLNTNVFVCASTIENSPNSLGEAQIIGVPCVSSFVGGVPDMIPNEQCGLLYRCEDVQVLAFLICKVFKESSMFDNTEMRRIAKERHNPLDNASRLIAIYNSISCNNEN